MQINREHRGRAVKRRGLPGERRGESGRLVQMMSVMRFHSSHRLWLILRLNPALCAHGDCVVHTHIHIARGSRSHRGNERQEEAQIWVDKENPQVISHTHTHTHTHKHMHATHSFAQRDQIERKGYEELLMSFFWAWDLRSLYGGSAAIKRSWNKTFKEPYQLVL